MIKAVLLILLIFLLARRVNKPKGVIVQEDAPLSDSFDEESLKKGRLKVLPLIEEWITQINAREKSKKLSTWEFVDGEIDLINFTFLFDSKVRTGKLYFKDDNNHPRVSKCIYEEDGMKKTIKGLTLPKPSMDKLISSMSEEKADSWHLSYINKVASKALKEGSAEFSILEYDDIKPSDFEALYGKREVKAFCKMLEKEDFERAEPKEGPMLTVIPRKMPDLDQKFIL